MKEKVVLLSAEEIKHLDDLREWVKGHLDKELHDDYDKDVSLRFKVIQHILDSKWINPEDGWKFNALGVVFGDALVERNGLA